MGKDEIPSIGRKEEGHGGNAGAHKDLETGQSTSLALFTLQVFCHANLNLHIS